MRAGREQCRAPVQAVPHGVGLNLDVRAGSPHGLPSADPKLPDDDPGSLVHGFSNMGCEISAARDGLPVGVSVGPLLSRGVISGPGFRAAK